MKKKTPLLLFSSSFVSILTIIATATDTITMSQSLTDGQTIISAGGSFELGFFSPGNPMKRYLGIWYNNIGNGTVAWVANRETPLEDSSGVLKVTSQGILVLLNRNNSIIWSTNSSSSAVNPIAQLLDSGNLVMRDGDDNNSENFLWQSFDYPCDTQLPGLSQLPGMKLGINTVTGFEWYLSSWKSTNDPSSGDFISLIDPRGFPQLVVRQGSNLTFRAGPWNGLRFSGTPNLLQNSIFTFGFTMNQQEMYYTYELINSSVVTKFMLNPNGILQRFIWIDRTQSWSLLRNAQTDNCDNYHLCGAYGNCVIDNSPVCGCLEGFVPKLPNEWDLADWSNGCVRGTPLNCTSGDGFIKYSGVKLPDTRFSWFNVSMSLEECMLMCLKNCSCMAYTSLDISIAGGNGCLLWFGDLIDMREFAQNGQDIFIRMASSAVVGSNRKKRRRIIIGLVLSLAGMLLVGLTLTLYLWKKKKRKKQSRHGETEHYTERGSSTGAQKVDLELPLFDFITVANATNNFSINNKLGEGGFGPVYMGVLDEGQQIAVKRLSKNSEQGLDEFMNEVSFIAKLQHRNLVKLLGCCIQEEKMLIYEYMSNKSLDLIIFDETRSTLLTWSNRFHIINGIARGLLYLHQDSRLRIVHRDLKAANILVDYDMNPKISDFGMARSFGGSETEANTNRVVGTYGYMPPEYAIDGIFSIKSDVFSFGVLVLEIVSGKKNKGFYHPDHRLNLLGHAWRLYGQNRLLELVDASIGDSYNLNEVLRSIQVALLCVQRYPEDRSSMSSVLLMLSSENELPQPKEPGFYTERNPLQVDSSSSQHESCSANEITFTLFSPR